MPRAAGTLSILTRSMHSAVMKVALRKLVHLFKYGKVETLGGPLSGLLLQAIPREERFDVIIAMPMHWRKRWERGFNQAELLARPVAKRFGMKFSNNLGRKRYTKSASGPFRATETGEPEGFLLDQTAEADCRQARAADR